MVGDAGDLRGAGGGGCGVGCDWGETRHLGFGLWGRRRTGVRIRQGRAGCGGGRGVLYVRPDMGRTQS